MFNNNIFSNKKVLITGNTGFKGSWLSIWLDLLGANIYCLSLDPPTNPSLFEKANLENITVNNEAQVPLYFSTESPKIIRVTK